MAIEVHDTHRCDMDCLIKECVRLFHNRQLGGHLSLSFCIEFFRQCVSITVQCVLAFAVKKKITLAGDVYFRAPITIRSHDLHAGNIKGAVGEIASNHERD